MNRYFRRDRESDPSAPQPYRLWRGVEQGIKVLDLWVRAGAPETGENEGQRKLFDLIVNPQARGGRATRGNSAWYRYVASVEGGRQRLLGELLKRRNAELTRTVFANVMNVAVDLRNGCELDRSMIDDFWSGLSADEGQWQAATLAIAEYPLKSCELEPVLDQIAGLWRKRPKSRGALFRLLLARIEEQALQMGSLDRVVPKYVQVLGIHVGPAEMASFLALGADAMALLPQGWPALFKGWSRADVLIPFLEGYVADPRVRARDAQEPWRAIGRIVARLREEKAASDLAKLRSCFEHLRSTRPADAAAIGLLVERAAGQLR